MKPLPSLLETQVIKVGARSSRLSLKQVEEIEKGLRYHHPNVRFAVQCCDSKGDIDQQTSLRAIGKTNFFTKEIDEWVLKEKCRIGIHSAKDLPDPLPSGLEIAAITAPLNTQDVIVFHPQIDPNHPPENCVIATSSKSRERQVLEELPKAQIVDLRGTIEKRLKKVFDGKVDGVVIAKVALMRLGYFHLNERILKGETTPHQGSLAILCRQKDFEIKTLFSFIDSRQNKKSLYFGLCSKSYLTNGFVDHLPLIEIKPRAQKELPTLVNQIKLASHLLITSQTTVRLLLDHFKISKSILNQKKILTVGQSSAEALQREGLYAGYVALVESQEGLIELMQRIPWRSQDIIFYPKSKSSRPKLEAFFKQKGLKYQSLSLYDSNFVCLKEKPNLALYDELVFTSSSTVNSFFQNFDSILPGHRVVCRGDVTRRTFEESALASSLKNKETGSVFI